MHDRSALGVADVDDDTVRAYVADLLGEPSVRLLSSHASPLDYALTTLTTGSRCWVHGEAETDRGVLPWRLVVKVAQTVERSPLMAQVPSEFRPAVLAGLPWQIEPNAYRSRLSEVLPDGMRLPRCLAVNDLDDDSTALWLEAIDHDPGPWDLERYGLAARALGRLAADPSVAAIDPALMHPMGPHQARRYFEGRLSGLFLRAYADEDFWRHPVVAAHVDAELRGRIESLVRAAPSLIDEIEELPLATAHGDACPQNLLVEETGLVAIDWGFWCRTALGHDLSQLVISEIDLGRAPACGLPDIQEVALEGYRAGLADRGTTISADDLERAHAVLLAIASGISAIPVEQLFGPDAPALHALVGERTAALRIVLDGVGL